MYPVTLQLDPGTSGRNRLTVLLRYFTAIPVEIVAFFYAIGVFFAVFIAWFAIMFTGRYPQGLYDFTAKGLRMFTRVNGYGYLLTDAYPPFNGDPDESYPVRVEIGPAQEKYSRLRVFFRYIMLWPVYLVLLFYGLGLAVVTFIAWFAILFTGRYPEGMFNFARNALAYTTRASAFALLLTDKFPPISDEPQVAAAPLA
jgi:hypothetical protein